jgi:hypothetical protein
MCIVAMLLGAFQYGYVIGALSGVLQTKYEKKNAYIRHLQLVSELLKDGRVPRQLRIKLREYFKVR